MPPRKGHSTVSPYIMASGAPRLLDFLGDVFGATVVERMDRDDGTLMHASVKIGDSVVMISQGTEKFPAFPVWLHVYTDDVDAAYRRALDLGGVSVQEPADQPDGDRRGGVRDRDGNIWWIATAKG